MVKKAEGILEELSPNFSEWTKDLTEFLHWQHYGLVGPDFDEFVLWESMEQIYASIFEAIIEMSGIRDSWGGPRYLLLAVKAGLEVYHKAEKLECPFHFGTDEVGFYLSADLIYSEAIRKMDDRFWLYVAELTRFGVLDLWEHRAWPDSRARQEPWFHKKTKSRIFHLIRSAVAWEKEEDTTDGLGMLIIRWRYDTPWELLLEKGSMAFHNLYRINEALWKKRPRK